MPVDVVGFAYAAAVAAGGMVGYAKAGSIPSLGAGLVFGSILTFGAYQASQNPPNFVVQLVSSATLAGVMGMRYRRSGKLMPAGIICIMSTAIMLRAGFRFASQYLEPAGLDKTAVTSR